MNPFALVDVSFPNIQSRELQNNNFILFCAIQFMILYLTIPKIEYAQCQNLFL